MRCPTCDKTFEERDSDALPFCSRRCRQIDLGRWLNESYGVPFDRRFDDEDESPEAFGYE